ncbi:MAG: hypothetical protein ACYSX0_01420 [Planctomycetota bacterium]
MKRFVVTIVGLAVVGGAAIFIGSKFLEPAQEKAQSKESVLTGAYAPRLDDCRALEDGELPEGLRPPAVGEDLLYVSVVVLYPGAAETPDLRTYLLDHVNGVQENALIPIHTEAEEGEEGMYVYLTFRTDGSFESGRLVHDAKPILEHVSLE